MADPSDITLRPLETRDDYESCVHLQREMWGKNFLDVVPAAILMVSQRVGGVAAGAFDRNRRLLGFVFGVSGVRDGGSRTGPTYWGSDRRSVGAAWVSG